MQKKMIWIALIAVLVVGVLAACAQPAATAAPSGDKSEAEILIDERCSRCHSTSRVYNGNYSADQWSAIFDNMIAKGADVSEEEKSLMIDWLVASP